MSLPQVTAARLDAAERAALASAQAQRAATPSLIGLREVGVRYGAVQALQDVTLEIAAGESVALIGGNGSGKSTLLRVLGGLVAPNSGQLHVPQRHAQAMLFQHPWMLRASARNNIAIGLWLRGVRWRDAQQRALDGLERVQMAAVAQRNARALSGGQQQRLALARAWAQQPELMLLDEPTASLDPHGKREVEALMHEFANAPADTRGRRLTMVFASHNLGQVKRLARRVVYLEQGRVLADLPVARFFDRALLPRLSPQADLFLKGEL